MSKIQDAFPAIGRKLFESEEEAVAAFKDKYADANWSQAPYTPPGITATVKVRHVIPAWPYKQFDSLIERVTEVEQFVHKLTWVANDLQVNVPPELFERIYLHEEAKQMYTYFVGASSPDRVDYAPGKRWIKISRTLFVEEN